MARTVHLSQSLVGALMHWSEQEWIDALSWITRDDGAPFASVDELKTAIGRLVESGTFYVPFGPCDNFDPTKGCLGHEESIVVDLRATP